MKKLTLIASVLVLSAMMAAAADTVYSVNVAGFSRMELPSKKLMIAGLQFEPFDATLLGLFGTNQLKTGNNVNGGYGKADKISLWITTNVPPSYRTYAQRVDDRQFHDISKWTNALAENPAITNGDALWIQSGETNLALPARTITFMGQAVATVTQEVDIGRGLQLVSYPFSSDFKLDEANFVASGAKKGNNVNGGYGKADQIAVWDVTLGTYATYGLNADGLWHSINNWTGAPVTNLVFPLSQGFWYNHYTGSAPFVWFETNKYLSNLQ